MQIVIEDTGDGDVRVTGAGAGQVFDIRNPFRPPLPDTALRNLRWYLEEYLQTPFGVWEDGGPAIAAALPEWGEALFSAVFADPATRAFVGPAFRSGERLAVIIQSASPQFLGLPWELLRDPATDATIALGAGDPEFDRSLPGFREHGAAVSPWDEAAAAGERLRLLMVIARPQAADDVAYQGIARPVVETLKGFAGRIAFEVLRPPTRQALADRLAVAAAQGRPYHVLHFDGHGSAGAGGAHLMLEMAGGGADPLAAADFAAIVTKGRVPVVVLNACRSAALPEEIGAAVATALLAAGADSVVAMAYIVRLGAAAAFMQAFYAALFAGRTVSQAVSAGRQRLAANPLRISPKGKMPLADWLVPVHYCRRSIAFLELAGPSPGSAASAAVAQSPSHFVGRDAWVLALEQATRDHRLVLVQGMAGVGKTQLAKAFGDWLRDTGGIDDANLIVYHAFRPGAATTAFTELVNALAKRLAAAGCGDGANGSPPEWTIAHQLRKKRALLILDNAEHLWDPAPAGKASAAATRPARLLNFLQHLTMTDGGGASATVLLVARGEHPWPADLNKRLTLPGLNSAEADEFADLLLQSQPAAEARRQDRAYRELRDWLNGHPLAMQLVLPQLANATAGQLLDGLRGVAPFPTAAETTEPGLAAPLVASIKTATDRLPREGRSLLVPLSLLDGAADWRWLAAIPKGATDLPPRFAGKAEADWKAAVAAAVRVGLLSPDGYEQHTVHPALRLYLATHWRAEAGDAFAAERAAIERQLIAVCAVFADLWTAQFWQGGSAITDDATLKQIGSQLPAFTRLMTAVTLKQIGSQRPALTRLLVAAVQNQEFDRALAIFLSLSFYWSASGMNNEERYWIGWLRDAVEPLLNEGRDQRRNGIELLTQSKGNQT